MKPQIDYLLKLWARWAVKSASAALGYPAVSPMFKDAPRGDAYGSAPPAGYTEFDILAIDAAIGKLPSVLRLAVWEAYQRGGSLREVGARMGVDHKTVGKYLTDAHEKIAIDIKI